MSSHFLFGLDIGGTKVEAVLAEMKFSGEPEDLVFGTNRFLKIHDRQRIKTEREQGYKDVVGRIAQLMDGVREAHGLSWNEIAAIGVGLPGTIHPKTQRMRNGNSQIFIDQDFSGDLDSLLPGSPAIYINNDANCFAFAEAYSGAGQKYQQEFQVDCSEQTAIGIILGTGCGGGLTVKGDIFSGQGGGGMEVGHTVLIPDGRECYCGRKGCAEQYLSGSGLALYHPDKISGPEIFERASSGDKFCKAIISEYRTHLSLFLTNLANTFDPHYIVLGGGLSNQAEIYAGLEESVAAKAFLPDTAPKIYQNQLGDSAGVFGAIYWAYQQKVRP